MTNSIHQQKPVQCGSTIQPYRKRSARITTIAYIYFTTTVLPEEKNMTDHKPLVAILKKYTAMLSHRLQHILLKIHQYIITIIYKTGLHLYIADILSR